MSTGELRALIGRLIVTGCQEETSMGDVVCWWCHGWTADPDHEEHRTTCPYDEARRVLTEAEIAAAREWSDASELPY